MKHKAHIFVIGDAAYVKNKNGKPYRMAGSITDITEQKLMLNKNY